MQTMFHYSLKEHVPYGQEKKMISHPVNFAVFHITRYIFFVHTAKLITKSIVLY